LRDGKPVEFPEDGGDVVSGGSGEKTCGRVLDVLEFIEELGG